MEIVIYFDSSLENLQRINAHHKCEASPKDVAQTVYPNWYSVKMGKQTIMNPNYQKE